MKLITQRDLIRGVAEAWKRNWLEVDDNGVERIIKADGLRKYKRLARLDPETATPADVAKIIESVRRFQP